MQLLSGLDQLRKQTHCGWRSTPLRMLQFNWIGTVGGEKRQIGLVGFNPSMGCGYMVIFLFFYISLINLHFDNYFEPLNCLIVEFKALILFLICQWEDYVILLVLTV